MLALVVFDSFAWEIKLFAFQLAVLLVDNHFHLLFGCSFFSMLICASRFKNLMNQRTPIDAHTHTKFKLLYKMTIPITIIHCHFCSSPLSSHTHTHISSTIIRKLRVTFWIFNKQIKKKTLGAKTTLPFSLTHSFFELCHLWNFNWRKISQ